MNVDYKISNDGTIFKIREDGSISKIARIDDNGNISDAVNRQKRSGKGKYWFFITLFLITTITVSVLYIEMENDYYLMNNDRNYYHDEYEKVSSSLSLLHSEINHLKQERDNVKSTLSQISDVYPLIINDIEIANVNYNGDIQTNYGYSIYSSGTMYLQPRIKYTGLISGNRTLKVKWYNPDGTIRKGTSSPYGFSQSESVNVCKGDNTYVLSGWGNSSKGHWGRGTYRIEIWYEDSCLKSKTFTIY